MTTALLLDVLLKGIAVLAFASVVVQGMKRTSAAARHLFWTSALIVALIIPFASVTLPAWRVLPGWRNSEAIVSTPDKETMTDQTAAPTITLTSQVSPPTDASGPLTSSRPPLPIADINQGQSNSPNVQQTTPGISKVPPVAPVAATPPLPDAPALIPTANPDETASVSTEPTPSLWLTLWLAGVLFMILPLALSALSLYRLERRSQRLAPGPLSSLVTDLCREIGLRQRLRILVGPMDTMPMVWGIFRNRLLLPLEATSWSEDTLRAVLFHELAHLNRRDPLTLFLSHLSLALHWPNPFAWFALRGVRMECEKAADDAVLRHGVRPSDYANDMLSLSEQCRPLLLKGTAVSMARRSSVTKRISAVLEGGRNRGQLTIRVCVFTVLSALLLALPLAMLQTVIAQEEDEVIPTSFEEQTKTYLALRKERYSQEQAKALNELEKNILKHDPEQVIAFARTLEPNTAANFISGVMAGLSRKEGSDLDALVKRVNEMKFVIHREQSATSVVRAVAEKDPALALSLIPRFMVRSEIRQAAEAFMYEDLIVRDPAAAADFLVRQSRNQTTYLILPAISAYWGARDLSACLNWARTLPHLEDRHLARHSAIQACARKQPKEIVTLLEEIKEKGRSQSAWLSTPPQLRGPILNVAYRALTDIDADAVDAWMTSLPNDGSVPENWCEDKRPADLPTIADARKLPEGSQQREEIIHQRLEEMASKDPKRALELSLLLPTKRRNDVASSAARSLYETDLNSAVAFFDKHPVEYAVTNGDAFVTTYLALAQRDLAGAEKVLALASDPRCKTVASQLRGIAFSNLLKHDSPERAIREASNSEGYHLNQICSQWLENDRAGFFEWMTQSPENKALGLVALISETIEEAPLKAAEYIIELDPLGHENPSSHWHWRRKINELFSKLLRHDEKYALDWAKNLKSRDLTVPAWFGVASHLVKSDSEAAAKWIASLPPGSGRKAAAQGFFQFYIQNESLIGNPFIFASTAFKADSFGEDKEKAIIGIVTKMKPEHYDDARLVLNALDLEEETHQRILNSFPK